MTHQSSSRIGRLLLASAAASLLAAPALAEPFSVGPVYHPPVEAPVMIGPLGPRVTTREPAPTRWWGAFGDPELDSLIARGLQSSLDIRIALDRVREARALFRGSQFDLAPHVTTDGAYTRAREQEPGFTTTPVDLEEAQLGFNAAWELDLFGRVRHEVRAARADSEAARDDLRGAQVLVVAEIARNYFILRGAQARRAVAEENARTAEDTVHLTQVRNDIGTGDPVDLESARARLEATQATIPTLRAAESAAAQRLAVLVGLRPRSLDAELAAPYPGAMREPVAVPIGEASDFLRRRPDVLAAERRLAAETDRTGAAVADLFPRITVTGFIGFLSGDVGSLFKGNSQAWSIAPAVSWPGLDIGTAQARLRGQHARQDEVLATYQQTVLRAVEDLQDAVVAYRERQDEVLSLSHEVEAARRAAELAHIRYKEGRIDFLRVLDAERSRLDAEDALTQAQTNANTDVVTIYQALGGDVQS
jgi:outer membrane protein, multidrug efflux system